VEGIFDLHYASLPVAWLVKALHYKPEDHGSIPDGIIASCLEIWEPQPSGTLWAFNLLAPELFFLILAHPLYKMRIIQEPNMLDL